MAAGGGTREAVMQQLLRTEVVATKARVRMRDGVDIEATIYSPRPAPFAAVVYAHGGAFASGNSESHAETSKALARMQMAVVDTHYRQGPDHAHPAATRDLADVTRYAREL